MRYVIIDCGSVGVELARLWTEVGHQVVGTTPDAARLPRLQAACTEATQLTHDDADRVREVAANADGVVLAARPQLLQARSLRDRVITFRRSLISVVRAAASVQRRLVLFSSIVVYGDGGSQEGPVTEQTPVTTSLDPAGQSFAAVERMVLQSPEAAVLRLPDAVVGQPDSPDLATALRDQAGDALPFDGAALTHLIDYRDAAAAVAFVVAHQLTGVFNVVPDAVPAPTNEAYLGKLAADAGVPPFTLTGELKEPRRPVSSAKLRDAGFTFRYS